MISSSVVEQKKEQYIVGILSEIYKLGATTIAKLAKTLKTSVPSITVYINELIEQGWVEEIGSSHTKSGRRPSLFNINPDKRTILVIDINVYRTDFFLVNLRNEFKDFHSINININTQNFSEIVLSDLKDFLNGKEIWAAGVVSPGLINNETGINYTYPYHNVGEKSFINLISEALSVSTFICHDSQAALIGEHHFGLAKGRDNVLMVNLDWGIGLGVLCNGVVIKGSKGFAGELGHIQVKPDGALCKCGKIGCLETVASASVLINNAKLGLQEGEKSILIEKKDHLKIEDIIEACDKKDEFSVNLVNDIGNELGKGLAIAVHLFNPEKIIIEGILSQTSDIIIDAMQKSIRNFCLFDFRKDLKIEVSPLGKNAKILGMKSLVFSEMLSKKLI